MMKVIRESKTEIELFDINTEELYTYRIGIDITGDLASVWLEETSPDENVIKEEVTLTVEQLDVLAAWAVTRLSGEE